MRQFTLIKLKMYKDSSSKRFF